MTPDRREGETCDYAVEDKPGLYKMTRAIAVAGAWHRNEMIVRNPAYGRAVLRVWEACLREGKTVPGHTERRSGMRHARGRAA